MSEFLGNKQLFSFYENCLVLPLTQQNCYLHFFKINNESYGNYCV